MVKHNLFPTLVSEFHNPSHETFKEIFLERFHLHCNAQGESNENTSHVDLHQDPHFSPLFEFIFKCLRLHLKELALDPEIQQMYLVKSWLSISRKEHAPIHNHADAHMAFVYYVNIPTDFTPHKLCFLSTKPNEYYPNIFSHNALDWNPYNCNNSSFVPCEGMALFFPAKLFHYTGNGNEKTPDPSIQDHYSISGINNMRVCLAGDLIFTYKKIEGKSFGLMPVSNWIKAS